MSSYNHHSLRRGRLIAGACAVAVMTTAIVAPASADVDDQKKKADGKVAATQQNLDDTSAQLVKVNNALVRTDKKVAGAQQKLKSANTRLTKANNHLRDMRSELAIAKADESKNKSALATNKVQQAKSKILVGGIARQSYMSGGLGNLQLTLNILTSHGDVTSKLSVADMVMRQQGGVLSKLASERANGTAAGDRLSAARRRIATLTIKATNAQTAAETAQHSATTARNSVVSLQKKQTEQRNALKKQKKIELANLAKQKKESNRLAAIIRKRNIAAAKAAKRARETALRKATPPVARSSGGSASRGGGGVLAAPGAIGSIVSGFGMRVNPVLGISMLHAGDDFPYACGTPVHAARGGTVASTGWDSAGGNFVLIDHGYIGGVNIASYYAHFERSAIVRTGQHVSKGQLIGYSGSTGRSTGCHMHFGVMANGRWVNPIPYIS
ncbi:MAG TPA: peptidoglycan DD-metalloendopeptidase family protein [Flexivirga sp.]|uniref:peptidoglycan DD-metalloendopeptidase family protein n=1 Tax=Flexivirga sp. TaxID=1962927 RepID=UPI002CA4F99B|nr:peptidoglycan DD-metalloendopeptidase family protein [Flexivirga sp.]HWC21368.1 peptidoglycan DD-metalloendopeptidase family protein [Flexivirga sp.]